MAETETTEAAQPITPVKGDLVVVVRENGSAEIGDWQLNRVAPRGNATHPEKTGGADVAIDSAYWFGASPVCVIHGGKKYCS